MCSLNRCVDVIVSDQMIRYSRGYCRAQRLMVGQVLRMDDWSPAERIGSKFIEAWCILMFLEIYALRRMVFQCTARCSTGPCLWTATTEAVRRAQSGKEQFGWNSSPRQGNDANRLPEIRSAALGGWLAALMYPST